jgi:hypothetical protein
MTEREKDRYLRLLMILITAHFDFNRWFARLSDVGIDEQDAAQEVLVHLAEKAHTIRFSQAAKTRSLTESDSRLMLLASLHRSIGRKLIDIIRAHDSDKSVATPESVLFEGEPWDDDALIDNRPGPSPERFLDPQAALLAALKEAEDRIVRRVRGSSIVHLCACYRYLSRRLVRDGAVPPHERMTPRLRKRVSVDEHAEIAFRINTFAEEWCRGEV